MSAAPMPADKPVLNVAILAATDRRFALAEIVTTAGHRVTDTETANVVLCESEAAPLGKPALFIGPLPPAAYDVGGHLPTLATAAQIDAALRAVAAGLHVRSNANESEQFDTPERTPVLLTPRELQILTAISDGASNKAIARDLSISLHTVKFHVESLFRKLNVRTRAEAVAKGLERRRAQIDA